MPEFIDPDLGMKTSIFVKNAQNAQFHSNSWQETPVSACFGRDQMGGGGGSFQILGLRRGRDQLLLMPKERP